MSWQNVTEHLPDILTAQEVLGGQIKLMSVGKVKEGFQNSEEDLQPS